MINLSLAEWIVPSVLFVFVYLLSVPIVGYFQAWVSQKMGDTMAEDAGFLTLNPLVHIDPIGLGILLITHLGWGKFVPIDPLSIKGKWRLPRILFSCTAGALISVFMALIALIFAVLMYGSCSTRNLLQNIALGKDVVRSATAAHSSHSSFMIIIGLFLLAFVFFNVFIAVLNFMLNGIKLIFAVGSEQRYKYAEHSEYLTVLAPLFIIFFFAHTLRYYLLFLIMAAACKIASLFGVS